MSRSVVLPAYRPVKESCCEGSCTALQACPCAQVLKKAPESYEALFRLAKLWKLAKRPEEALKLAKVAATRFPQDVEVQEHYADCLR